MSRSHSVVVCLDPGFRHGILFSWPLLMAVSECRCVTVVMALKTFWMEKNLLENHSLISEWIAGTNYLIQGAFWDTRGIRLVFFKKKNERKRDLTWGLRHGEMVSLKDPKGKWVFFPGIWVLVGWAPLCPKVLHYNKGNIADDRGVLTHAPEEIAALTQRLRPLGQVTNE